MLPSESETLFKIMDSMSSDQSWRVSSPDPCKPGSSWPGIECRLGLDNHFHVSRLDFGTIPFELGNLKNLVVLDLSYNALTGVVPTSIGQLGVLQKLDLSSNSLMGHIPDSIEKLSSLAFIALSNNKLNGNLPTGLSKLQNLQYFIMDDNPMNIPLPVEFGKLVKLQELRLANSGYLGTIPTSFSLLSNLTTLSLQNNRLIGEIPVGFGSLSHIYHLNLSRNLLGGIVPFNTSFLKRLGRNLDLSGNPGLCLSPNEAYNVKIGVGVSVCGTSKNGSLIKKSQASHGFSKPFFIFSGLMFLGLNYIIFLV
ncbi:hypothetical protein JCGZ_22097 [Jatropha curcas]|uniref:Leucine-rich repeat-containing N-terminal plant-type domain-containing protein n=1 Tax=Jatropha curcas TaxID=180498 RepID=A0A067JSP6_JATCU|nr:hypothetical protein JCGZ_22097 [Jatropha curcas]